MADDDPPETSAGTVGCQPSTAAGPRVPPETTRSGAHRPGIGLRNGVPPASHAEWSEATGRTDPVDLLERQAVQRSPDLIPIGDGWMLQSPFAFFRGGAGDRALVP